MATAIQIPDRPSFIQRAAQTMALADAVKTRKQTQEVEDLYRRTDDPEQIKAGLRSAGATDAYLKFTQHLSGLELDQLQMAKERNLALKSKFDMLSQVAHGLDTSDPAVRDQLWVSTARPSLVAQGIPEEMLPENWQDLAIYRNAKQDAEMAEKAIANEEKRREAERQAAEHIVAQEKAAMEKVKFRQEQGGVDPEFESYFRNELAAQNIQPGQLNAQSEAQARKKALEDYKRLGDAPQSDPADVAIYKFYEKRELDAGRTPMSFPAWQTDEANRRRQAPSATIQINSATQASTKMPPETSDALNRATMTMPSNRRLQVFDTVNQMYDRGNTTGAKETIKQAALESEPVAVRQTVQGRREVLKALSDIETLLKDVPQNIVVGTVEDVIRTLGTSTNTDYVRISNRLRLLNQAYRRSMTGAAFSAAEAGEYSKIFPDYTNTAPVNAAQIQALREAFGVNDSVFWNNKLGEGWTDAETTTDNPVDDEILRALEGL